MPESCPTYRVRCDEPNPAEPIVGAVLQQAGHGRAVDQGGQAGGKDDVAESPPVPVERGAAVAERDRIQLGQPVAAAGAIEGNRNVVVDQLAAATGEDRRPVGKSCLLLLAVVGREPSDAALVRKHAAADSGFAAARWVSSAGRRNQPGRRRGVDEEVSEKLPGTQSDTRLCVPDAALSGLAVGMAAIAMAMKMNVLRTWDETVAVSFWLARVVDLANAVANARMIHKAISSSTAYPSSRLTKRVRMMPRSQKMREITGVDVTEVAMATTRRVDVCWPSVPVRRASEMNPRKPRPSTKRKLAISETVISRIVVFRPSLRDGNRCKKRIRRRQLLVYWFVS
jgi:hypothetical protein